MADRIVHPFAEAVNRLRELINEFGSLLNKSDYPGAEQISEGVYEALRMMEAQAVRLRQRIADPALFMTAQRENGTWEQCVRLVSVLRKNLKRFHRRHRYTVPDHLKIYVDKADFLREKIIAVELEWRRIKRDEKGKGRTKKVGSSPTTNFTMVH